MEGQLDAGLVARRAEGERCYKYVVVSPCPVIISAMAFKRKRAVKKFSRSSRLKLAVRGSRRVATRSRKNVSYTSRNNAAVSIRSRRPLTARKRRQFRNALWTASSLKQKYRSIIQTAGNFTAGVATSSVLAVFGFQNAIEQTNEFWTAAGGLQAISFQDVNPIATPTLVPKTIFLRGGMITWNFTSRPDNQDAILCRVQLVYMKGQQRNITDTGSGDARLWLDRMVTNFGTLPIGMTVEDMADFDQYFHRPILDKEVLLRPGESMKLNHKLRAKRIDADAFTRGTGCFPVWFTYRSQQSVGIVDGAETVNMTWGHNISFTVEDT